MAFGVDLGTTNSSIAWSDDAGDIYSLRVRRGPKIPFDAVERSLVLDPLGDDPVVGADAETAAATRPNATLVRSFKRRFDKQRLRGRAYRWVKTITREYDPVEQSARIREEGHWVPLEYDRYSRAEVIAAGGQVVERLLTASELSPDQAGRTAFDLLSDAAASNQERLYVGVPVTFGPTGRRRLLAALVASGCFGTDNKAYSRALDRCRLVYEPLALVSTLGLFEPQNVLVVDYGGGTLDLAVLEVGNDEDPEAVKELGLGGLPRAGDALDAAFRDHLLETRPSLARAYRRQVGGDSDFDRLLADFAFANAKIRLSTENEVMLPLFNEAVTREELERAIRPEIDAAIESVRDVLERASLRHEQIGTVQLTGGSSLVPLVQHALRHEFPGLDELGFRAGTPGDEASELETLTGVSRGLARFGFLERFETTAACDYSVHVPRASSRNQTVCLPRGAADIVALEDCPVVQVGVVAGASNTFALYSNLVRETYCGALIDVEIPPGVDHVDVRVSAARERFTPAFSVTVPGRKRPLAIFDIEALGDAALARFVEGDGEWLPVATKPDAMPLVRPLELGDFVTWRNNGDHRSGKVLAIREVASNAFVPAMDGFDPSPYAIRVAIESDGEFSPGRTTQPHWHSGDVRLD